MIEENYNNIITLFKDGTLYVEPINMNSNERYNDDNIFCNDVISFVAFSISFMYMTSNRDIFYVYDGIKMQIQPMTNDIPDTIIYYQKCLRNFILFGSQTAYHYSLDDNNTLTFRKSINIGSIDIITMINNSNSILKTIDNRLFYVKFLFDENNHCYDIDFIDLIPDVDNPTEFISDIIDIKLFGANIMFYLKDQTFVEIKWLSLSKIFIINGSITFSFEYINASMFEGPYESMPCIISINNIYVDYLYSEICLVTEDNCLWEKIYKNSHVKFDLVINGIERVYLAFSIEYGNYGGHHTIYLARDVNGNNIYICDGEEYPWPFPREVVPIEFTPLSAISNSIGVIYELCFIMNDNSMYGLIITDDGPHFERIDYYSERPLMPKQSIMKMKPHILKSARTRDI